MVDGSNCPENENSTDCLLRNLLKVVGDRVEAEEGQVDWDPITFAFTVPVGVFGILAAVFALVAIFQAALASGRGRRKSSKQAIGKWSKDTTKRWNWHELNRLSIARTPILQTDKMLGILDDNDNDNDVPGPESDNSAENSSAATWLAFLEEVGLQNLKTDTNTLKHTAADYLPDDLQAVPAYGEVGCIVAMAAAAGVHTLKTNADSMYPVIIGHSFQFDFRQHPILGTVGAFARYGTERARSRAEAKKRVWLALRHAAGYVETTFGRQVANAPDGQAENGRADTERHDTNGHDNATGTVPEEHDEPPRANPRQFVNVLRPNFNLAAMFNHGCQDICSIDVLSSRQDGHHILWLVIAATPSQVPAIFPSRSTGIHNNLSMFALQSRFWSTPRAMLLNEIVPTILPSRAGIIPYGWDIDAGGNEGQEDGGNILLEPGLYNTRLTFSITVFQACLRFLYGHDAFENWFSAISNEEKYEFRKQTLQQLQLQDVLLRAYPESRVVCRKTRLFLHTLGLLDLEHGIKNHTARFQNDARLETLIESLGQSIPAHDILGQHKELVAGLALIVREEEYGGDNYEMINCVLGNDSYIAARLRERDGRAFIRSLHRSLTGYPAMILAYLGAAREAFLWSDGAFQVLSLYAWNKLGALTRRMDVIDIPFPEWDEIWHEFSRRAGGIDVRSHAGLQSQAFEEAKTIAAEQLPALYKSTMRDVRSEDEILDDILVWRIILLAMLFWTAPDNSDLLASGLLRKRTTNLEELKQAPSSSFQPPSHIAEHSLHPTMRLIFLGLLATTAKIGSCNGQQLPLSGAIGSTHESASSEAPSYRSELLSLHKSLIDIPSISGNENEVGKFLIDYLVEKGYKAEGQPVPQPGDDGEDKDKVRFNVVAWRGQTHEPKPKVLVTSHIDVVPPHIPYEIEDGEVTKETMIKGRGSVDAKASVAAMVIALQELLAGNDVKEDDVMLLFVVGEEATGSGMRVFSDVIAQMPNPPHFKAAIFGEPTENKLACGHKGGLFCNIEARGVGGHSGYPWLGKSANELMIRAMAKILDTDLGSSELYGNTTFNVGRFDGGVAANVIPEYAKVGFACRVAIGPEKEGGWIVRDKLQAILDEIDKEAFELDCTHAYGAVDCTCDVDGFENIVVNYGTDVPNLEGDHTRYLYGPGTILVAHGARENITVGQLETAVEGYQKLILHALKN
ncbi:Peptidase M17 domain-containing protein [Paramyrothecium foliicola]|nr:Peptidase M17 domain-containing protein [Paramyrothecium foliicola]